MTINKKSERKRGLKEAREQIGVLQAKWPAAFPKQGHLVRPLATSAPQLIAAACGWSLPYTRGVLNVWKNRRAYCVAAISYPQRITLDGSLSNEQVDAKAIALAKERLAVLATRNSVAPKEQRGPGATAARS